MKLKQYPKYNESGVPWIGEMPEEWKLKKLKHVSDILISNVDKKSDENEPEVRLCNYVDVYKNEFITSDIQFMKATASYEQIRKLSIKKNDVIITKDSEEPTDIAVPALVNEDLPGVVCGYHLALIKPNPKVLHGAYLLRSFQSKNINDQFVVEANGVTRFGISTYPILNSYVLIPPKPEQFKIASFLDTKTSEIDALIEKDQKLIELLKEKRIALINHAVTKGLNPKAKLKDSGIEWIGKVPEEWNVKKLKLCVAINRKTLQENTSTSQQINYLDISNVDSKGNVINYEELFFEDAPSRARRIPKKGDTILSTVRTYLKAIAYLNEIPQNTIVSTGFAVLEPSITLHSKYLFYAVSSEVFIQAVIAESTGVAYPAINPSELSQISLILPPKPEQLQIASFLDAQTSKIDKTVEKIQKKIELLSEYKKSLIHHVVTGKVDVRASA